MSDRAIRTGGGTLAVRLAEAGVWPWLALHVAGWTLYATLSNAPADIHHDMAEAFAWGREFQAGYFKHPPFWAWIAGAWFAVMPRTEWAFYLLSMANAGLALWGVWLIAGRFLTSPTQRLAAVLLLELTPFYHFLAFKFNANTALLSLWAWAIYFFLRVVEDRSLVAAVGLGVAAGLGLLSKYYFGVLLAGFGLAALSIPGRKATLLSPAPWIAVAIAALIVAPHLWWLAHNDFAPFRYVSDTAQHGRGYILWKIIQFGVGCLLFHIVVIGFLGFFSAGSRAFLLRFASWRESPPPRRLLLIVTLAPPLATMLIALASNVKIDTNFAIPIFPAVPLLLMTAPGYRLADKGVETLRGGVPLLIGALIVVSPFIGLARFAFRAERADEPRREAARAVEAMFVRRFGAPLRIVGGAWPYADEAPFYVRGEASQFIDWSPAKAPWITRERLRQEGAAAICPAEDEVCAARAREALSGPLAEETLTVARKAWGLKGRQRRFLILLQPPAAAGSGGAAGPG